MGQYNGDPPVLLRMRGIVKRFPGVRALDGVDLDVRPGEVHCLLGQNGAGKSTLIKVLAGAHRPDEGEITFGGEPFAPATPTAAMRAGIATIYQELDLVDGLSVTDNVFLGHERSRLGFTRREEGDRRARELLARLGHGEIPPRREAGRLPAAGRQVVSMARALSHEARLIVMDEPSAALAHDEVDNLFRIIRELTREGVAVVYISHRLAEIREIGDRVTVLKDGRTVARDLPARTTPTNEIVALMTGRDIEHAFPDRPAPDAFDDRPEVLRVEGLTLPGSFEDVSFAVRAGEIVGLAGLVGSGRSEILETVYGARRATAGRVLIDGRPVRPGSPGAAVRRGMGLAPEERKSQALLLDQSVAANMSMAGLDRYSAFGWLNRRRERADVRAQIAALDIRPPDPDRPVATLSGGNQQKVVLARWLLGDRRLLVLDEPTRGVDVGARAELYGVVRELAARGIGVLLVSSEVPEVLGLADRVLVVREGRIVHEGDARGLDEPAVLNLIMEGSAL
ncbi:sugar ABC transporter ATP-binding protein [Actinomadura hibisca]|uniref:sugar ABC transporter ATP-binding protein n=1 Tax=Actinomadura hibisca TaxID=68565 RepID=UPI000831ACC0|nr:sugar ABC transporter ATP-binding protein [Actinomadura hibisca]